MSKKKITHPHQQKLRKVKDKALEAKTWWGSGSNPKKYGETRKKGSKKK